MAFKYLETSAGWIEIVTSAKGVEEISFLRSSAFIVERKNEPEDIGGHAATAVRQLKEYFSGERKVFDMELNPKGTPFQIKIWDLLKEIPWGEVATYKEVAARSGNPKAARAVGMASNRNPLAIVVPCHRVVGSRGQLTGYRGGLEIKSWLLELESQKQPPS